MRRGGALEAGRRTYVARAETRLRQGWTRTRMRRTSAPRVLVVDVVIPAHDRGAGHLRLTWILRLLRSLGCHVTLFTTHQRVRRDPYAQQLERLGIELELSAESFSGFADSRGGMYDLVLLSGADAAASVVDEARRAFPEATIIYDSIDLHFLRQGRKAEVVGGPSERDYWHAKELVCIRRSDLTATVTETEAEIVRSLVPTARTVVLPVVYEPDPAPRLPYDATRDLLFIGGFLHDPNIDAVQYFVRDVLPLITAEVDARLWVVGQQPPEEIRALESASVVVTGHVPDVEHHLRRARVLVSPVRYGAGMKGKNVHAMAHGLPLVTTTIGAEGMDLEDGRHALIRDGAEAFAAAVVALYRDPALWAHLATNSREVARTRWSPAAMRARLDDLLDATARQRGAPPASALRSSPRRPAQFALVSEVVPPSWSGQAVLIRRLLTGLDPRSYCLLTSDQGIYGGEHIQGLETTCYRLPAARTRYLDANKWLLTGSALAGAAAGIAGRAIHIARVVRRERCRAIVAFTGDFHDLPAAYLASRLLRLPLYVYMCDYYSHRELYEPARRRLSPHLERIVVRGASRVICGTDTLADALADRYGVAPAVIHHPADLSLYALEQRPQRVPSHDVQIVYTGTIYEAQLDAVQNLLAALEQLGDHQAALHVYGGQPQDELRTRGLQGRLVVHQHASAQEIAAVQEGADILFLPLAFRSQYPEVIRTSAPMKFGEYLAAGGPIIVHAPADAFISEYCRDHACALVVDDPDPRGLAEAIETLCDDAELRARLIGNAQERAVRDFAIDVAHARFAELLNLQAARRCAA